MPVEHPRSLGMRATISRPDRTAAIVQAILGGLRLPDGWRLHQVPGHIDATWSGPGGRWARFSLRFVAADEPPGGTVLVTFDCSTADQDWPGIASVHDDETLDGAFERLEPLTAAVAEANRGASP